jgi:hypothetical protein
VPPGSVRSAYQGTGQLFWKKIVDRRQFRMGTGQLFRGYCAKGASSNPLSELAGQTNQSGWQHHRKQMTCRHLRISSSSFLGSTTSFSGSNPSKAVSALLFRSIRDCPRPNFICQVFRSVEQLTCPLFSPLSLIQSLMAQISMIQQSHPSFTFGRLGNSSPSYGSGL